MDSQKRVSRILVVDDDTALREAVARQMRRAGYQVVTADSAEAALEYFYSGGPDFDAVITDVHMPRMNGVELASILLQRRPTQRIVIVTGDSESALGQVAMSRWPVSYLLKPFELFELEAMVNQTLAQVQV